MKWTIFSLCFVLASLIVAPATLAATPLLVDSNFDGSNPDADIPNAGDDPFAPGDPNVESPNGDQYDDPAAEAPNDNRSQDPAAGTPNDNSPEDSTAAPPNDNNTYDQPAAPPNDNSAADPDAGAPNNNL